MHIKSVIYVVVLIVTLLIVTPSSVFAHSPVFPTDNSTLDTAHEIDDPAKSWAIYSTLSSEKRADYYSFVLSKGEKMQLSLITATNPARFGFLPSFCLMTPNSTKTNIVPDYVEVPINYGTTVIQATAPSEAKYEPFTPSWIYTVSKFVSIAPIDGTYYIAVYDSPNTDIHSHHRSKSDCSKNYALIVGYLEEFTLIELIQIPYRLNKIYIWEGQNQFLVFMPMLLVVIVGGTISYVRNKRSKHPKSISKWLAIVGGLLFIGTAAGTSYQIVLSISHTSIGPAVLISLAIVGLSVILGIFALRYAFQNKSKLTIGKRVTLVIIGLIAFFVWSGYYIGPAVLIIAGLIPKEA